MFTTFFVICFLASYFGIQFVENKTGQINLGYKKRLAIAGVAGFFWPVTLTGAALFGGVVYYKHQQQQKLLGTKGNQE